MSPVRGRTGPVWLLAAAGGAVALILAYTGSLLLAAGVGLFAVLVAGLAAAVRLFPSGDGPRDPSRRRFLSTLGLAGVGLVAAGAGAGRGLARMLRPDPGPVLEEAARDLGSEILLYMRRGYYPGRTGELQLALRPFTVSNYPNESLELAPRDPRTSHAAPWLYLQRVPIVIYAPGIVTAPAVRADRVTLADLAPTIATLMGFAFPTPDGSPLPGISTPARPPRVIVTFVIDGGGWNALTRWPRAWPNMARLMREGILYRDAVLGSYPAVTASAHATIGTGAFPSTHGIVGHNMREGDRVLQPFGDPGSADTSRILVPTLAEAWAEHTGDRAWIGLLAYQIWHLSMIGRGGRPLGELPVGTYWDEGNVVFAPQNPDAYRLPNGMPERERLSTYLQAYHGVEEGAELDRKGKGVCCGPPMIRYQGDMIAAAFQNEPIGADDVTDLVYINYKSPDYAGHVYNMLSIRERIALQAVDVELGRLVDILEARFEPDEFALIVTADHGQSPLPNETGGARVDPIQLKASLERAFGPAILQIVQDVKPSEIYVREENLWDVGVTVDHLAAYLRDYRYRDNLGNYLPPDAVDDRRLDDRLFAAVLPAGFIGELTEADIARYGAGRYPGSDPGIPETLWELQA
jgi:hypothetical protein